jgi:hypothetical protein
MGSDHSRPRTFVHLKSHPLCQCGWAQAFVLQCLTEWVRITGEKTMRVGFFVFDPETNKMIVQSTIGHPSGISDMFKTMRAKAMMVYRQAGGGETGLQQQAGRVRKVLYRGSDGQIHTAMVMGDWNPGLTTSPSEFRPACTGALLAGLSTTGCVLDPQTPNVFAVPDGVLSRRQ